MESNMECPGCGKSGPYTPGNGYEILSSGDEDNPEGLFRCEDCDEEFWWP